MLCLLFIVTALGLDVDQARFVVTPTGATKDERVRAPDNPSLAMASTIVHEHPVASESEVGPAGAVIEVSSRTGVAKRHTFEEHVMVKVKDACDIKAPAEQEKYWACPNRCEDTCLANPAKPGGEKDTKMGANCKFAEDKCVACEERPVQETGDAVLCPGEACWKCEGRCAGQCVERKYDQKPDRESCAWVDSKCTMCDETPPGVPGELFWGCDNRCPTNCVDRAATLAYLHTRLDGEKDLAEVGANGIPESNSDKRFAEWDSAADNFLASCKIDNDKCILDENNQEALKLNLDKLNNTDTKFAAGALLLPIIMLQL